MSELRVARFTEPAPADCTELPVGGASKRVFDFVVALATIALLLPLFVSFAAAIRLFDGRTAFYGHRRIGFGGRSFTCWKFRTMVSNSGEVLANHLRDDPASAAESTMTQKLRRNPRVTPIGRFLRACSLDELPQLWNMLSGQMSVVGPRPIVENERARYGDSFPIIRPCNRA